VNEKISDSSSFVSALCCMMAGEIPISVNRLKNAMITGGDSYDSEVVRGKQRANIPATTREMMMPLYLASAV
jgi:hypothetical protein